jgi:two-component system OmpR family response regulator/two-component system response regulator RstA
MVILDVMLPDTDGLQVLKRLREFWRGPVLMLPALGEDSDTVAGLALGADDYIIIPVAPRVLLARIRGAAPAQPARSRSGKIDLGFLRIDVRSREVLLDGSHLELTTAEFDLLVILARRAGRVQERARLLEEVRGFGSSSFDRSVDVLVSRLRRKMGPCGRRIKTLQGVGYCLGPGAEDER